MRKILSFILAATLMVSLCGCMSLEAIGLDEYLAELELKDVQEVSLHMGESLQKLWAEAEALSERDRSQMENLVHLQRLVEAYEKLEADTIAKVEEDIRNLPKAEDVRLASEEAIKEVRKAFNALPETARAKVSNEKALADIEEVLKQVKEACWVDCDTCGGDGKVVCKSCGGSGSRKVWHTTPNGKKWQVSQDCKTTQNCSECGGKGGTYVEENP